MEILLATDFHSGKPTNFGTTFKAVTQFLHDGQVPHVFVGTLALNTYVRPRYTQEIQLICGHSAIGQVDSELNRIAEQTGFIGSLKVEAPTNPAMTHALISTRPAGLFDTTAHVPTAPALCWLFLESDELYSLVDVGSLLAAGAADSDALLSLLEQQASDATLIRFGEAKRNVEQERYAGTYSDNVRARQQRLQRKDGAAN